MNVFDPIRIADARHRVAADVRALTSYSLAVLDAEPEAAVSTDAMPTTARWAGVIGMEETMTGDARLIEKGALRWEATPETPLPIRYVAKDVGAHDGAEVVGSIFEISRRTGGVIWANGDFDMSTEAGRLAYVAVRDKRQNGVSMDLDDVSFDIRIAGELLDGMMGDPEDPEADPEAPQEEPAEPEKDAAGRVTVASIKSDDEVMVTTGARVRAATIVAVPAFAEALIDVVDEPDEETQDTQDGVVRSTNAITASGVPLNPPSAWFAKRDLSGPTPMTVTPDGQVYGHLATWGSCHISHSAGGKCVTPPNSPSDYAWFHTGALETSEGDLVSVGHLTMNTGHAADDLSPANTLAHYDNTGTVAADVRVYEDAYGIQFAGALRTTLSPEQIRAFRAAPLSGDWRRVGYALELVGALAVNVPGYGVPRPHGMVKKDSLVSLVASGMIVPVSDDEAMSLSGADFAYLRSMIDRDKRQAIDALAARRNRVRVAAFARRRKA